VLLLLWPASGCAPRHAAGLSPNNHSHLVVDDEEPRAAGFALKVLDLGRHPWHSQVEFEVDFENWTQSTVVVAALKASCDCTAVDPEQHVGREVPPGKSVTMKGVLETGSKTGKRGSELALLLDTGAVHALNIEFEVYPTFELRPGRLDFVVNLDDHQDDSDAVQLVDFVSETSRIAAPPSADVAWLEAIVDESAGGAALHVHVLKDRLTFGDNHGQIRLEIEDPLVRTWLIPVTATGKSDLRAIPGRVFVRVGEAKRVRLVDRDGVTVQVASAVPEHTSVRCALSGGHLIIELGDGPFLSGWIPVEIIGVNGRRTTVLVRVME